MIICPCDEPQEPGLENLPAGLDSLPRQLRSFPEARHALLGGIVGKTALANWKARDERDLGLMWLEMWAYVSDVLAFYDERIANESYLRTSKRRPSLRRLVDLLGFIPAPGVAGAAPLATIAEGKRSVLLKSGAGFRSNAFGTEPPQVFESGTDQQVEPLANQWLIGPTSRKRLGETLPAGMTSKLIFSPEKFGLAKDRLVLVSFANVPPGAGGEPAQVARVSALRTLQGEDAKTYVEVTLDAPIVVPSASSATAIEMRVQTPTVTARVTQNTPSGTERISNQDSVTAVYFDARYPQLKITDLVIAERASSTGSERHVASAGRVTELPVQLFPPSNDVRFTVTFAELSPQLSDAFIADPAQLTFHFSFVDAGQVTLIDKVELTAADLSNPNGVPIAGIVETPPNADNGILEQDFLIQDKDKKGAFVHGRMTFDHGNATFQLLTDPALLPFNDWKTPITVFGNVVQTTRGETVTNEVLGSGDPRTAHQQFKLKKKPLTYVAAPESIDGVRTTLTVRVDGIAWKEVRSFFGAGPQDQVFTVRTNDAQESVITFGDGVRGARVPAGVKNITASYRFGAGKAAPPADSITSLKGQVKGIRSVVSPVAALPGRDPDSPEDLRKNAPQSALLFGRLVSIQDFEVIANRFPGVTKAVAEWAWFKERNEAGVAVHVIADKETDTGLLKTKLIEKLRAQADPTVPVSVDIAKALFTLIGLNLEVDPRFEGEKVVAAVRAALYEPETGILSPKNATIGGTFWTSRLYDAVLAVPGVVGVQSGGIAQIFNPPIFIEFDPNGGICVPSGSYLDWGIPENAFLKAVELTGPIPPPAPSPPLRSLGVPSVPSAVEPPPPAQDGYDDYYKEKLWALVPEIHRTEDGLGPNPNVLRQIVEVIAEQAAVTRRSIDRLWEDESVETCDDWAVPYIGDLLATRPVTELDPRGGRVNVARTIFYRRRRGTPHVLERIVHELSGWDVILVEAFEHLARMRHRLDPEPPRVGKFTLTPQGGTADLRSARSAELVDTPFDEFFRTPDVRRQRGFDGRFNIRKLNFHLYRRQSYEINNSDPFFLNDFDIPTYTFDPSGRDIPLFARGTAGVDDTHCRSEAEWEVRKPIPCRLLGHAEYFLTAGTLAEISGAPTQLTQIIGERFRSEASLADRLISLGTTGVRTDPWYRQLIELAITDDSGKTNLYPDSVEVGTGDEEAITPFDREVVTSGNLGCSDVHPEPADTGVELIIDPVLGRFSRADQDPIEDPGPRAIRYFYGFTGEVGAGAYPRGGIVAGGTDATPKIPGDNVNPGVSGTDILTFPDDRTYLLAQTDSDLITDAVVQAADGRRPFVLVSAGEGSQAAVWTPTSDGGAKLLIDGVWFGTQITNQDKFVIDQASPPVDPGEFDWDEITIRSCTLDPGGRRADNSEMRPMRLIVRGRVRRLAISRSIIGLIDVDCETGFVESLEIEDSIIDAHLDESDGGGVAIRSTEGEVRLRGVTVIGDIVADVLQATDCLVTGTLNVLDQFESCFRFSAASPGGTLPKLYHAEPKQISEGTPLGPILFSYFQSIRFGDPGYAAISLVAPDFLRFGSEVGSELGAFSWMLRPIRLHTVEGKVEEFKPVGMLAQYFLEGEFEFDTSAQQSQGGE